MKFKFIFLTTFFTYTVTLSALASPELCVDAPLGSSTCDIAALTPVDFATWNESDWINVSDDLLITYQWSNTGLLLRSEYGAWFMGDQGALIAKGVGGNVAVTAHIRPSSLLSDDAPTTPYSSAGLVLAVPGMESVNNIVFNTGTQWYQSGLLMGSTQANETQFSDQPGEAERWLRLCRIDSDIFALTSDNEGESWQIQHSWSRPDIPSHVLLGLGTNAWNGPVDLEAEISHLSYFTPVDSEDCTRSLNPVENPPEEPEIEDPVDNPDVVWFPFDDSAELDDWNLLHDVEARPALHTALNIEQGILSLQLINSGWWMNEVAPLILRNIEGDFILSSRIIAESIQNPGMSPVSHYNSAGLMVRNGLETENWANLVIGTREVPNQMTHTRTTNGNSQSDVWGSALDVEMRVCRINGELHWLSREISGGSWVVRDIESISGWPASLQVGMAATAWFGQTPDINAQFDYIQINDQATTENCYDEAAIEVESPEQLVDPDAPKILMFVPYNNAWWAEYIVAYQALIAQGYNVEVRSDYSGAASSYGSPVDNTEGGALGGVPVEYETFLNSFNQTLGNEFPWQVSFNQVSSIPVAGALVDVVDMDDYVGLYIVGGTGIEQYRIDGSYAASTPSAEASISIENPEAHTVSAEVIGATAAKLQDLVNLALNSHKPVAAVCHAASIMPYMRQNGTLGAGSDGLGVSILVDSAVTGYALTGMPQNDLDTEFSSLAVDFYPEERVLVSSPAWLQASHIHDKLITASNWYPETVAYVTKTFINTIKSTPASSEEAINILVFGGDEPSHYASEPLRYTDLENTLNSATGSWNFNVTATSNINDITLVNLANYDVLVYFRHNNMPQVLEDAVRDFADNGGGVVGLHHAIYNQQNGNNTLVNMFGAELPGNVGLNDSEVAYTESNHPLFNVNLGHFITTYRVDRLGIPSGDRGQMGNYTLSNPNRDNVANQGYFPTTIFGPDEIYAASHFFDIQFGEQVNAINPLVVNGIQLSNGLENDGAYLASGGWTRLYDYDGNGVIGRIVYLQPGETATGTWSNPNYRQMFINSVVWAADAL